MYTYICIILVNASLCLLTEILLHRAVKSIEFCKGRLLPAMTTSDLSNLHRHVSLFLWIPARFLWSVRVVFKSWIPLNRRYSMHRTCLYTTTTNFIICLIKSLFYFVSEYSYQRSLLFLSFIFFFFFFARCSVVTLRNNVTEFRFM